MFKDARARRAWSLYFFKAEAVLSPLAVSIRRELVDDLKAHVRDILVNERIDGDELTRLNAALERVGDPKEFLTPLMADAVFKMPPHAGSLGMTFRTLSLYASKGTSYMLRTLAIVLAATTGLALSLASLNSLLRPDHAGFFRIGDDEYQLRVMGFGAAVGEQLLAPWMAVALVGFGFVALWWTATQVRRILLELVANAA